MRFALLLAAPFLLFSGCEKTCKADDECELPAICGADHHCAAPAPASDGAACKHDLHCAGKACLFAAGAGTCATACESAGDCTTSRCALSVDERSTGSKLRFTCGAVSGDRFAAETCTSDSQCKTGLCHDGHCTTPCGTCPTAFACGPTTLTRNALSIDHGVCSWWPAQPVVELGAADTPESAGKQLELTLPAGFGAFTLVLEDSEDRVPAVTRLVSPEGTVFIGNARPPDAGSIDLARCSSSPGTATVLVPGSDDARALVTPGKWQLEVVTYDAVGFPTAPRQVAGRIDRVAAVLKKPARGGVVDVTLHVAPETGYLITDAGTFVPAMLDRFGQVLRDKLGVAVGEVRLLNLPADAGVAIDSSAQARAMWAAHSLGAPAARPVNVMMVRSLSFAGGVSGGVPGAPGVYGRPGSGIALEPLASGPQSTGVLMAHEVLHYLGLFHSSDDFLGPDLVSDTPVCANPSGAGCPDERNLMFPYFPTREPLTITAGQAKVLEGSPWLYQWVHPGACGAQDVIGLSAVRYAAGTTSAANLAGVCGGSGGEAVHLVRLEAPAQKLVANVTGNGFTPVLYVRRSDCGPAGTEVACAVADGGVATASIDNPSAGAYFIVVDSVADGGAYRLGVTVTP